MSLLSHPSLLKRRRCVASAKYLDIAKKIHTMKSNGNRPKRNHGGGSDVRSEKGRSHRDKSDISDRSAARLDRGTVRHATFTVGEVVEELNVPNTGAAMQAELYRRGSIKKENAIEWITKAILVRRGIDTSGWRGHAPAVESALTRPPDRDRR
jgi:hypothetical protein